MLKLILPTLHYTRISIFTTLLFKRAISFKGSSIHATSFKDNIVNASSMLILRMYPVFFVVASKCTCGLKHQYKTVVGNF